MKTLLKKILTSLGVTAAVVAGVSWCAWYAVQTPERISQRIASTESVAFVRGTAISGVSRFIDTLDVPKLSDAQKQNILERSITTQWMEAQLNDVADAVSQAVVNGESVEKISINIVEPRDALLSNTVDEIVQQVAELPPCLNQNENDVAGLNAAVSVALRSTCAPRILTNSNVPLQERLTGEIRPNLLGAFPDTAVIPMSGEVKNQQFDFLNQAGSAIGIGIRALSIIREAAYATSVFSALLALACIVACAVLYIFEISQALKVVSGILLSSGVLSLVLSWVAPRALFAVLGWVPITSGIAGLANAQVALQEIAYPLVIIGSAEIVVGACCRIVAIFMRRDGNTRPVPPAAGSAAHVINR